MATWITYGLLSLKLPFFLHAAHGFRQILIVLLFSDRDYYRVHFDPQQEIQNGMWEFTLQMDEEILDTIWLGTLIAQDSWFSY